MEGVVDLGDGRYTGKPCSRTGGRGESGGLFDGTPGGGNIAGKIRDALCDRYTDSGIYENSVECNRRKKQVAYLEKGRHIGLTGNELEKSSENQIILIGEPVIMESLAAVIETEYQISVRVICPLREKKGLLADGDIAVCGEEELEQALQSLKNVKGVVADPLYRPVCPENVAFYELPHIAFSGRIYKKKLPVLAELI